MSALDTVTSYETVQFIIVGGVIALSGIAMVIRAKAKSDVQSYIEAKESRQKHHEYTLEEIKAKAISGSVPGKANKQQALEAE